MFEGKRGQHGPQVQHDQQKENAPNHREEEEELGGGGVSQFRNHTRPCTDGLFLDG